jgi:hypothetical protein
MSKPTGMPRPPEGLADSLTSGDGRSGSGLASISQHLACNGDIRVMVGRDGQAGDLCTAIIKRGRAAANPFSRETRFHAHGAEAFGLPARSRVVHPSTATAAR